MAAITLIGTTEAPFTEADVALIAQLVTEQTERELRELGVELSDLKRMRELNRMFRGEDTHTDVLAFPDESHTGGDVVICTHVARDQAAQADWDLRDELFLLAVHGSLHLVGYDHGNAKETEEMRSLEQSILNSIGITPRKYL
jgi:probable rRNA maturation factor